MINLWLIHTPVIKFWAQHIILKVRRSRLATKCVTCHRKTPFLSAKCASGISVTSTMFSSCSMVKTHGFLGYFNLHLGISQNWVTPHQIAFHICSMLHSWMFHGSPIKTPPESCFFEKIIRSPLDGFLAPLNHLFQLGEIHVKSPWASGCQVLVTSAEPRCRSFRTCAAWRNQAEL